MPFIVTTRREGRLPGKDNDAAWSRRAVATLDGRKVWNALYGVEIKGREEVVEMIASLPESGGTVGPLPDGTLIEVETATDAVILDALGWPYDSPMDLALAAFNAKQAA